MTATTNRRPSAAEVRQHASKLVRLAVAKQAAWCSDDRPSFAAASAQLTSFGDELGRAGGLALMVDTFDVADDLTAANGGNLAGVGPAWDGLHGWVA